MAAVNARGAERVFFLGDGCAPFVLNDLAERFAGPIDGVFGNNDGDRFLLCRVAARHPQMTWHDPLAELEVGGRKILLTHYPEIGRRLAKSGEADAVFSYFFPWWPRPLGGVASEPERRPRCIRAS